MDKGFAITRYQRNRIKYDETEECYKVPSQTNIRDVYHVFHSSHKSWTCDCLDFTMNICRDTQKNCKHIWAVIAFLKSKPNDRYIEVKSEE